MTTIQMQIHFTTFKGENKIAYEEVQSNNIPNVGDTVRNGVYGLLTVKSRSFSFGQSEHLIQKGEDTVWLKLERE